MRHGAGKRKERARLHKRAMGRLQQNRVCEGERDMHKSGGMEKDAEGGENGKADAASEQNKCVWIC